MFDRAVAGFVSGWPRKAMRIHLAVLPSSMRTAFMLYRFRRLREKYPPGRELARARKILIAKQGIGAAEIIRISLQDFLERKPAHVALFAVSAVFMLGALIGAVIPRG